LRLFEAGREGEKGGERGWEEEKGVEKEWRRRRKEWRGERKGRKEGKKGREEKKWSEEFVVCVLLSRQSRRTISQSGQFCLMQWRCQQIVGFADDLKCL